MGTFQRDVERELDAARQRYEPINTLHEGWAVIFEETNELWEEVKKWKGEAPNSRERVYRELVQIAAMCQRMAEDLQLAITTTQASSPTSATP